MFDNSVYDPCFSKATLINYQKKVYHQFTKIQIYIKDSVTDINK